MRKIGMWIIRI